MEVINEIAPKPSELKSFKAFLASRDDNVIDARSTEHKLEPLFDWMYARGWSHAGAGKYSQVYKHPNYPYVLKVFQRDTAYMKWVDFCMKHPDNPYCPKFRGRVIRINQTIYAVRIERLRANQTFSSEIGEIFYLDWIVAGRSAPMYRDEPELIEKFKNDHHLTEIGEFFRHNSSLMDVHNANIMWRGTSMTPGNNQLVIVDPFYNWYKEGAYRIDPNDMTGLDIF